MALTAQQIANAGSWLTGQVWREADRRDFRPGMDLQTIDRFVACLEEQLADAILSYFQSTGQSYSDATPATTLQINGQPVSGVWQQGSAFKKEIRDKGGNIVSWEVHQFLCSGAGLVQSFTIPNDSSSHTQTIYESVSLTSLVAAIAALPAAFNNSPHITRDDQSGLWHAIIHSSPPGLGGGTTIYKIDGSGYVYQNGSDRDGKEWVDSYAFYYTYRVGQGQPGGHLEYNALKPLSLSHVGLSSTFTPMHSGLYCYYAITGVVRTRTYTTGWTSVSYSEGAVT